MAFKAELKGSETSSVWQKLRMKKTIEQPFTFIHEPNHLHQGRGLFVFRNVQPDKAMLLQAPHAKSDKYTGLIAAQLFSQFSFRSAMWNTSPRKSQVRGVASQKGDMAHLSYTFWQAMTKSFADMYPQGRVIQLHGFAKKKRKSAVGKNTDLIISAGHQHPPEWVVNTRDCLKKSLAVNVALYPYEVNELGATTNFQSQLLQQIGFNGFIHLEMSKSFRKQLLNRTELQEKLVNCLE